MSNVFTLDALREETLKRYEPVTIVLPDESEVELKSLIRLGKKDREAVLDAISEISDLESDSEEDDDDSAEEYSELVVESIEKIFKLIANKPKRLIAELDHEDPLIKASFYTSVLSNWIGETQMGEAESSPS